MSVDMIMSLRSACAEEIIHYSYTNTKVLQKYMQAFIGTF